MYLDWSYGESISACQTLLEILMHKISIFMYSKINYFKIKILKAGEVYSLYSARIAFNIFQVGATVSQFWEGKKERAL